MRVRTGLRLQILLLLGSLLVLAFVPLFFAVATYTSYTIQQLSESHARALGRSVAASLRSARSERTGEELAALVDEAAEGDPMLAVAVYDTFGRRLAAEGAADAIERVDALVRETSEETSELSTRAGRALAVVVRGSGGAVATVVRADAGGGRAAPLVRLVGLYTALVALALLVLAYFALTRLIVRPLDRLTAGARRVAAGARQLDVPATGPRELMVLSQSLRTMTERLLAEEQALRHKVSEVEQATLRLRQAQDRLVRSERLASVGRLAAGLAHEIGNPISALIGLQDLLLAGDLEPAEQRDFLERMRRETERIHHILRDLLQFARPAAKAEGAAPVPGDVAAAAYDTAALLAPQRALQEVALELDVHPDLPHVGLSREQLTQVLLNLVMNAADACGPSGTVRVRARPSPDEPGVVVEVEDTGPGVAPEVRARLFEPFVTTKEVGEGTGLGLAVCEGLVESAGGRIRLDEQYAPGARFVIELPAAQNEP